MTKKIGDIYRKNGIPGFLVDVTEEGSDTVMRFNFPDEMLENDKFIDEIERVIRDANRPLKQKEKVPGATTIDALEEAKTKHKGKELKNLEWQETKPVGDLKLSDQKE